MTAADPAGQNWSYLAREENFRFVKEILVHSIETGDAERLVGLWRSQGSVATLMKHGMTEAEIGLDALVRAAKHALGDSTVPWYWSYRVRIALR